MQGFGIVEEILWAVRRGCSRRERRGREGREATDAGQLQCWEISGLVRSGDQFDPLAVFEVRKSESGRVDRIARMWPWVAGAVAESAGAAEP